MFALAIHGGAGVDPTREYRAQVDHIRSLLTEGARTLARGDGALDVVVAAIAAMESSGLYVAGKGSWPNVSGDYELDASVMSGPRKECGAVCALQGFESPINVARAVMEHSSHVLLAGQGAAEFARQQSSKPVDSDTYYEATMLPATAHHGTVGAVALDKNGRLAAATSTGGTADKLPGRVGDTPLIGCATWADDRVAVSCTGYGEYFIRVAAAKDVADRMRYAGATVANACQSTLDDIAELGGDGGLIAIDVQGSVTLDFNSHGMKSGFVTSDSEPWAGVFEKRSMSCQS